MSGRLKFLVGSCQHVFRRCYYCITFKTYISILEKMTNIIKKLIKKLDIRRLNGHPDFLSGFQVIDPSNYKKMLKFHKNPGH